MSYTTIQSHPALHRYKRNQDKHSPVQPGTLNTPYTGPSLNSASKQAPKDVWNTAASTTVKPAGLKVRFGAIKAPSQGNIEHQAQNGVWITTERLPAKVGGLGEVSKTIPEAFAQYMPKKDLRIIVPYLGKHRDEDQKIKAALAKGNKKVSESDIFQPTGTYLSFKMEDGRTAKVEVLQKFEDATGFQDSNKSKPEGQKVGNWVYALRNDNYFMGKNENGVEAGLSDYTYTPEAGEFDKVMLFNRAASELVPLLDGNNTDPRAAGLKRFNNAHKSAEFPAKEGVETPTGKDFRKNIDFVIAHDWLTGTVQNELPDSPYTRKHFVVHNMFDKEQAPNVAHKTGLFTPERLFRQERTFSALNAGIEPSDSIWVNNNFKKTILESTLPNGAPFITTLRNKSEAQRTHNLHHGLSADYTASGDLAPQCLQETYGEWLTQTQKTQGELTQKETDLTEKLKTVREQGDAQQAVLVKKALNDAQKNLNKIKIQIEAAEAGHSASNNQPYKFQKLKIAEGATLPTVEDMRTFKRANKLALQKKLGLKQDTNAPIIAWAARLDPRQKNVYVFMESVKQTLKNNPAVQVVMVGDTTDPEIIKWIEEINKTYNKTPGHNRVYIPNVFATQDEVKQINAGADFTALPSLYEPYGLTQLEAMKMGSLPIVHGVDGLRSTISDPVMNNKLKNFTPEPDWETVWDLKNKEGDPLQNGILMEPLDIDEYKKYIDNRQDHEQLERLKSALDESKVALQEFKDTPDKSNLPADTETNLKEAEKKAFRALLGKFEGIGNTLAYRLKSYQIQLDALNQVLEREQKKETRSPKRIAELEEKIAKLKSHTEYNEQTKKNKLEEQALDAHRIHKLVKENPKELETHYQTVLNLVKPDDKVNHDAAQKLNEAIQSGIDLIKDEDRGLKTRIDAIHYVNTEHDWKNILQKYYQPALESDQVDNEVRKTHTQELNAFIQDKTPNHTAQPEYVQKRRETPKPSGPMAQIQYYWNQLWRLNEQFWATVGRLFSLRKD